MLSKITTNYFQPPSPKYMYNSIFLYLALKYLHKNCFEKQSFGSEMCVRDSSKASIGSLTFKPSAHSNYHSGVYVSPPQNIKFVFDSTDPEYLYAFQVSVVYWGKNIAQSQVLNIKYFAAKADTGTQLCDHSLWRYNHVAFPRLVANEGKTVVTDKSPKQHSEL